MTGHIVALLLAFSVAGAAAGQVDPGAASGEEPYQRYLVATRTPPSARRIPLLHRTQFQRFESVNGFVADLSTSEVEALRDHPEVRFVERDLRRYLIHAMETPAAQIAASETQPYGLSVVRAPELWPLGTGRGIRIGVMDTGVDCPHPDLVGNCKGGRDFFYADDNPTDEVAHGTHVAGTAAASHNGFGVVGVAPEAEIYSLKIFDDRGGAEPAVYTSNIIEAIDWAIARRLHILNLSFGCADPDDPNCRASTLENEAFERAAANGILVIAITGNLYRFLQVEFVSFPAAYPSVLAVGAVDGNQQIASFSQRGREIDLVAPGVAVLSTMPRGKGTAAEVRTGMKTYDAALMKGAPAREVRGRYVFAGSGRPQDFPLATAGKIAVVMRGELSASEQERNASRAGATAMVRINNVSEAIDFIAPVLGTSVFGFLPSVVISKDAGAEILALGDVELTVSTQVDQDYAKLSGTSMAAPHVAGVAALIWSIVPNATAQQVRDALLRGAIDLGDQGLDTTHGFGQVNAYNSARLLAPEKFPPATRRRAARRAVVADPP